MRKLVILSPYFSNWTSDASRVFGGIEAIIRAILPHLKDRYDVHVLHAGVDVDPVYREFATFHSVDPMWKDGYEEANRIWSRQIAKKYRDIAIRLRPDVVWSHLYGPAVARELAEMGIYVVHQIHEVEKNGMFVCPRLARCDRIMQLGGKVYGSRYSEMATIEIAREAAIRLNDHSADHVIERGTFTNHEFICGVPVDEVLLTREIESSYIQSMLVGRYTPQDTRKSFTKFLKTGVEQYIVMSGGHPSHEEKMLKAGWKLWKNLPRDQVIDLLSHTSSLTVAYAKEAHPVVSIETQLLGAMPISFVDKTGEVCAAYEVAKRVHPENELAPPIAYDDPNWMAKYDEAVDFYFARALSERERSANRARAFWNNGNMRAEIFAALDGGSSKFMGLEI